MTGPYDVFWDTCVFIRFLAQQEPNIRDINCFVSDARNGERRIHFSTLVFTELRPRHFVGSKYGNIHEFFRDLEGACLPIDPSPDILIAAGELRDANPAHPHNNKDAEQRVIGTPDSIHLMTCYHLKVDRNVPGVVFHTFDNGKGRNWEGKCVPLLSFQEWFKPGNQTERTDQVSRIERTVPLHPQLTMGGI